MNRHQRRSQYAVPSRSKPLVNRKGGSIKGLEKIMRFIERGVRINARGRKPIFMKRAAQAVKQALIGKPPLRS